MTGVQTCALPIYRNRPSSEIMARRHQHYYLWFALVASAGPASFRSPQFRNGALTRGAGNHPCRRGDLSHGRDQHNKEGPRMDALDTEWPLQVEQVVVVGDEIGGPGTQGRSQHGVVLGIAF